jgi:hypothetical protein
LVAHPTGRRAISWRAVARRNISGLNGVRYYLIVFDQSLPIAELNPLIGTPSL